MLKSLLEAGNRLAIQHACPVRPILVKIAPELEGEQFDDVIKLVNDTAIAGIIATNTLQTERGGKSGRPLFNKSIERVRQCRAIA